jgi:hypothetical protein
MNARRTLGLCLLCSAMASPSFADVTLKSKASGTGMVAAVGDMTQYIKGLKMRTDQTTGPGRNSSTIIDMTAKQMIMLNHETKEAQVLDMTALSDTLAKAGISDVSTSITPTTQTRQIAGQTCTVYDMKIAVPMAMGPTKMNMVLTGPQCLVKNGPGQAEFMAFYRAAAANGGFLDVNQAKARPAAAKAMTDMYKKMAELGVAFASEMKIGMEGTGQMAEMMAKMATTITTEVTSISTAAVDASLFEVPAGYKITKR